MTRTPEQNAAEIEIARMRLDQARDRLTHAIISGRAIERLEMVHEAAMADYKDLLAESRYMAR